MRQSASPLAVWAGILILYVVWGSTYLGIRIAVEHIPPFLMASARFLISGLLLTGAIALRNRRTIRRPSLRQVRDAAIVGAFLQLGGMGLVAIGEQTVASGIAALFIGLMPMWLAIFSRIFFGDRLPLVGAIGVVAGIAGIAILAWPAGGVGDLDPGGTLALVFSPVCWSLGSLYAAKKAILPAPALLSTGLQLILGGLALLLVGGLTGELGRFDATAVPADGWWALFYLMTVGSLVGYTTYAWLLAVAPLPRVSTYAYVNPVVAVFLGWLIIGEPISARTIVASAVIVTAVVLIITARGRGPAGREAVAPPAADFVATEAATG